jgi:DNA-binding MurR/RpiR family transcriptional regulator
MVYTLHAEVLACNRATTNGRPYADRLAAESSPPPSGGRRGLLELEPEGRCCRLPRFARLGEQRDRRPDCQSAGIPQPRRAAPLSSSPKADQPSPANTSGIYSTTPDELAATTIRSHLRDLDALTQNVTSQQFEAVAVLAASDRVVRRRRPSAQLASTDKSSPNASANPAERSYRRHLLRRRLLTLTAGDVVVALAYSRVQNHVRVLLEHGRPEHPRVIVTDTLTGARQPARRSIRPQHQVCSPSHGTTVLLVEALVLGIATKARGRRNARNLTSLRTARRPRLDVDTP